MVVVDLAAKRGHHNNVGEECTCDANAGRHHDRLPGLEFVVPGAVLVTGLDDEDDDDKAGGAHDERDQLQQDTSQGQAGDSSLQCICSQ